MSSYTGRDGQTHEYTNIDWDEKTKISTSPRMKKKDFDKLMKDLKTYQNSCVSRILAINPALAGEAYEGYVIRDYEKKELRWDMELIKGRVSIENPLTSTYFSTMANLLEVRQEAFTNNNLDLKTPQVKH